MNRYNAKPRVRRERKRRRRVRLLLFMQENPFEGYAQPHWIKLCARRYGKQEQFKRLAKQLGLSLLLIGCASPARLAQPDAGAEMETVEGAEAGYAVDVLVLKLRIYENARRLMLLDSILDRHQHGSVPVLCPIETRPEAQKMRGLQVTCDKRESL